MTLETTPAISVVVAVYDDVHTVKELADRTSAALAARGETFELIFVDDGSRDGTVALLRAIEAQDARVRVFELTRNFGQAAALACGLFAAIGAVTVTLDGDLQNPPEEIPRLLDAIEAGAAVATARRGSRYEGLLRWLGSRAIHWLACRLTGVEIEDYGGNFKAYRRDALETTRHAWAPGKPFFPLALWLGHSVTEVTVRHEPRRFGTSKYSLLKLLRINFDLITAFTTLPLALMGAAGALCTVAGVAMLILWAILDGAGWVIPAAALTLVLTGAVFFAGGMLGLYLGRVYRLVAGAEPAYVVRQGPRNGSTRARAGESPRDS